MRTDISRQPQLAAMFAALTILAPAVAEAVPILPDFAAATFTPGQKVDNPYFPLLDRKTRRYEGRDANGDLVEYFEFTNLNTGPVILGVKTTTQLDRAYEDGLLVEETYDFYAQDDDGNVWYFGEDVTNYIYDDDGNLIDTNNSSAWRAGMNGGLPGWIMPASNPVGLKYYQESAAADGALDEGRVGANDLMFDSIFGPVSNVLQVFETSQLSPDSRGAKYYAPGFGLLFEEEGLDANFENPGLVLKLVSVPAPAAAALFGFGVAGLLLRRRA